MTKRNPIKTKVIVFFKTFDCLYALYDFEETGFEHLRQISLPAKALSAVKLLEPQNSQVLTWDGI